MVITTFIDPVFAHLCNRAYDEWILLLRHLLPMSGSNAADFFSKGSPAALAAGVKVGRKKHPRTPTALELISQGESLGSVTEKTGISRSTYFRLKRTIKNDAKIATFSK